MTNNTTKACARPAASKPRERACPYGGKTAARRGKPGPESRGKPHGSDRAKPAAECRPNRPAIRSAATAQGPGGGPSSPRATQVVEGEHRKGNAKRS